MVGPLAIEDRSSGSGTSLVQNGFLWHLGSVLYNHWNSLKLWRMLLFITLFCSYDLCAHYSGLILREYFIFYAYINRIAVFLFSFNISFKNKCIANVSPDSALHGFIDAWCTMLFYGLAQKWVVYAQNKKQHSHLHLHLQKWRFYISESRNGILDPDSI